METVVWSVVTQSGWVTSMVLKHASISVTITNVCHHFNTSCVANAISVLPLDVTVSGSRLELPCVYHVMPESGKVYTQRHL